MRNKHFIHDQSGSILMVSLWMLLILSLLSLGLGYRLITRLKLAGYQRDELHVQALADAGLRLALWQLGEDKTRYDAMSDGWGNNPEWFKKHALPDGTVTIGYKTGEEEGAFTYGMVDEERKININAAPYEVLMRLPGMTSGLANSIIDWRDKDDEAKPNGAENSWYQELNKPYTCKNSDFEFVDELLLVKGCDRETLARFRHLVTVYGAGKVNINTAPKEVLQALGMRESIADTIIGYRRGMDGVDGTKDDRVFEDISSVNPRLTEYRALTVDDATQLNSSLRQLTASSSYYTVPLQIELLNGIKRHVTIVVDKGIKKPVLWKEE